MPVGDFVFVVAMGKVSYLWNPEFQAIFHSMSIMDGYDYMEDNLKSGPIKKNSSI